MMSILEAIKAYKQKEAYKQKMLENQLCNRCNRKNFGSVTKNDYYKLLKNNEFLDFVTDVTDVTAKNEKSKGECCWWKITFPTGEEKILTTSPPATLEELKALYREAGALKIEPYQRQVKRPERPLTPEEERTILAFLASIGEEDKEIIAEVMEACRCDQEAREYYLRRAKL
jgi:hypothetical protein